MKFLIQILISFFGRKGPLFLMAGNSIGNSGKAYALAAMMPFALVPIDDVPLLSYALANKMVNSSYNMTASTNDDVYTGLMNGDPYTSQEQKQRDLYQINDTDWHSVTFEGIYSSSVCHLALHQDWITQHGYVVDGIVNMNLPEQGISGPFRVTAIKHILPPKKPESDPGEGYEWEPVTGLFIHNSDQVHNITFDNNETIGVTAPHPIFSTTHNDWRLAGELEVGEKVLTYSGEATVTKTDKKAGSEAVYNLEVKDLHNFLVGDAGVVVHNGCWSSIKQKYGNIYQTAIDHCWSGHNPLSKIPGKSYFKGSLDDQIKLKQYITEAQGKGTILSETIVERTVDGVKRKYMTIVRDMGENVGKLKDHSTDTNILTSIFDITDSNPIINNAFPGHP